MNFTVHELHTTPSIQPKQQPKRWLATPLIASCALSGVTFYPFWQNVSASPVPRPVQLTAQANCASSQPPYRCITPAIFSCLKRNNAGGGGSVEYRGGNSGDIAVKSAMAGQVALLGFRFDPASQTLSINVKRKNPVVAEQQIWNGFNGTIAKCRSNPNR